MSPMSKPSPQSAFEGYMMGQVEMLQEAMTSHLDEHRELSRRRVSIFDGILIAVVSSVIGGLIGRYL